MKQFIVDRHTTPNTPTLEQVPTEKIPVYEDMAAAAADLANLAENQIIATHDTGSELSAPVDTVQSGNMHAVTSNAVANAIGEWTKVKSNAPLSEKYDLTGVKEFYLEWTNGSSTAIGYYYLPVIESDKTKYTVVGNTSNSIGVGEFNIDSNLLLTVYAGSWAENYSLWVKK